MIQDFSHYILGCLLHKIIGRGDESDLISLSGRKLELAP